MILNDLKDYIETLGITEHVYVGMLEDKKDMSVGVYNCKHAAPNEAILAGDDTDKLGVKCVTILFHWNKSTEDTDKIAWKLLELLSNTEDLQINDNFFSAIIPMVLEPIDIGRDEHGICEKVLEIAVIYRK